jgi:CheY-like chemotaxis protein
MKKILVIDESQLFRDYLKKKLEDYGFEVSVAVSGLDGASKLRSQGNSGDRRFRKNGARCPR